MLSPGSEQHLPDMQLLAQVAVRLGSQAHGNALYTRILTAPSLMRPTAARNSSGGAIRKPAMRQPCAGTARSE